MTLSDRKSLNTQITHSQYTFCYLQVLQIMRPISIKKKIQASYLFNTRVRYQKARSRKGSPKLVALSQKLLNFIRRSRF